MSITATKKQIADIARATKANCDKNGLGPVVNVFSDGTWMFGANENDVVARGAPGGGWDYRETCLHYPMTAADVAEHISRIE